MRLVYKIDDQEDFYEVPDTLEFFYGADEILSKRFYDLTSNNSWFDKGYEIFNYEKIISYRALRNVMKNILLENIKKVSKYKNLEKFTIEDYHKYVSDEEHAKIIINTGKLYPKDLNLDDKKFVIFVQDIIKSRLGYLPKGRDYSQWIILRLNRPNSIGFNPVHKDIYGDYDQLSDPRRMINVWIPLCGVNNFSGLPIVPKSHLFKESEIFRTKAGAIVNGQKYGVNCIKSWQGRSNMKLISPEPGNLLLFSSHLIHGFGRNNNKNKTRISLEFRLHAKD